MSIFESSFKLKQILREVLPWIKWSEVETNQIPPELMASLQMAHREWQDANSYFDCVSDPDLIDYAIFSLGASEQKYSYLLKRVREAGVRVALDFKNAIN